jgi:hypothetical protein
MLISLVLLSVVFQAALIKAPEPMWQVRNISDSECIISAEPTNEIPHSYILNSTRIQDLWGDINVVGYNKGFPFLRARFPQVILGKTCQSIASSMNDNKEENGFPLFLTSMYEELTRKLSGDRIMKLPSDGVCPARTLIGDWGYLLQQPGRLLMSSRGMLINLHSQKTDQCMTGIVSVILRAFLLDAHHFMVDLKRHLDDT